MFYSVSYQTYNYERVLGAAEQRAADVRAGEAAASRGLLRLRLGHALRVRHDVPSARPAARRVTGSVPAEPKRVQPSVR